jgi:hypothetical protein
VPERSAPLIEIQRVGSEGWIDRGPDVPCVRNGVFGFLDSVGARPFVPDEVESEVTEVR